MSLKPLEDYVCRVSMGMKLLPYHGRIVVALGPRKRDTGDALYWPILTNPKIALAMGVHVRTLKMWMDVLTRKGVVVICADREPRTGRALYRLSLLGQQIWAEAAAERKQDAGVPRPQPETEAVP